MPQKIRTMLSDMECLPSIKCGEVQFHFELEDLAPEYYEQASRELRETPDVVEAAKLKLKELLKAETDLYVPYENEQFLIRFLRPCKFYPESARDLIKRYYNFKVKHSNVYNNLIPSNEKNVFMQNILHVMTHRDDKGRRMIVLELGKRWKHQQCTLDEVFKGCALLLEAALLEPVTQVCGCNIVFDMDGLSMQQVWQFTPPFAKRIVDWLQEAIPIRLKGLHIVNQPYIFNMVFQLFKPFLNSKLKSRIIFHGTDRKSLHKHVSANSLPLKYGGTLDIPEITGAQWFELLNQCDKEYQAINSYGYKKK